MRVTSAALAAFRPISCNDGRIDDPKSLQVMVGVLRDSVGTCAESKATTIICNDMVEEREVKVTFIFTILYNFIYLFYYQSIMEKENLFVSPCSSFLRLKKSSVSLKNLQFSLIFII